MSDDTPDGLYRVYAIHKGKTTLFLETAVEKFARDAAAQLRSPPSLVQINRGAEVVEKFERKEKVPLFEVFAFHDDGEGSALLSHRSSHTSLDVAMRVSKLVSSRATSVEVRHNGKTLSTFAPGKASTSRKAVGKKSHPDLFGTKRQASMFPST